MSEQVVLKVVAVVCATGVLLAAVSVFYCVVKSAMSRTGQGGAKSLGLLFQRMSILRLATVVFCLYTLLLLEIFELSSSAYLGVIGSIASYVLGGLSKDRAQDGKQYETSEVKQDN